MLLRRRVVLACLLFTAASDVAHAQADSTAMIRAGQPVRLSWVRGRDSLRVEGRMAFPDSTGFRIRLRETGDALAAIERATGHPPTTDRVWGDSVDVPIAWREVERAEIVVGTKSSGLSPWTGFFVVGTLSAVTLYGTVSAAQSSLCGDCGASTPVPPAVIGAGVGLLVGGTVGALIFSIVRTDAPVWGPAHDPRIGVR